MDFNPRPISILLRYVAQCDKIRMLSLHHVNIKLQDIVKLSLALTTLEDLEISVPSTIGARRIDNGWEQVKSLLRGRSELKKVYFLESPSLLLREVQRVLEIRSRKELQNEFTFEEALQWSEKNFVEHISNISRIGRSRRGLCLISKQSTMKVIND